MNQRFDAGLRAIYLACLDRDLGFARPGILGDVVMPTRWSQVRRNWRYPPNRVKVTIHDVPMSRGGGGFPLGPGSGGGFVGVSLGSHMPRDVPLDPVKNAALALRAFRERRLA